MSEPTYSSFNVKISPEVLLTELVAVEQELMALERLRQEEIPLKLIEARRLKWQAAKDELLGRMKESG